MFLRGEKDYKCEKKINVKAGQKQFERFRENDFDVEDRARSGRLVDFNNDALSVLVTVNPNLTVNVLEDRLNSWHGTIDI